MKKLMLSLVTVLLLSACSSKGIDEITRTVCTNDFPYLVYESGQQIYTSRGDKVLTMEIRAVLELEDAETMAAVMESVEATLPVFNENKGMHASVEKINDTSLYDILIIDFEEADMSKVADMNILEEDSGKKITQVSLKQSIENIEEDGFVCRIES